MSNICLWCRKDTSLGTGLFVNRIPAWLDDEEGYKCIECEIETIKECFFQRGYINSIIKCHAGTTFSHSNTSHSIFTDRCLSGPVFCNNKDRKGFIRDQVVCPEC